MQPADTERTRSGNEIAAPRTPDPSDDATGAISRRGAHTRLERPVGDPNAAAADLDVAQPTGQSTGRRARPERGTGQYPVPPSNGRHTGGIPIPGSDGAHGGGNGGVNGTGGVDPAALAEAQADKPSGRRAKPDHDQTGRRARAAASVELGGAREVAGRNGRRARVTDDEDLDIPADVAEDIADGTRPTSRSALTDAPGQSSGRRVRPDGLDLPPGRRAKPDSPAESTGRRARPELAEPPAGARTGRRAKLDPLTPSVESTGRRAKPDLPAESTGRRARPDSPAESTGRRARPEGVAGPEATGRRAAPEVLAEATGRRATLDALAESAAERRGRPDLNPPTGRRARPDLSGPDGESTGRRAMPEGLTGFDGPPDATGRGKGLAEALAGFEAGDGRRAMSDGLSDGGGRRAMPDMFAERPGEGAPTNGHRAIPEATSGPEATGRRAKPEVLAGPEATGRRAKPDRPAEATGRRAMPEGLAGFDGPADGVRRGGPDGPNGPEATGRRALPEALDGSGRRAEPDLPEATGRRAKPEGLAELGQPAPGETTGRRTSRRDLPAVPRQPAGLGQPPAGLGEPPADLNGPAELNGEPPHGPGPGPRRGGPRGRRGIRPATMPPTPAPGMPLPPPGMPGPQQSQPMPMPEQPGGPHSGPNGIPAPHRGLGGNGGPGGPGNNNGPGNGPGNGNGPHSGPIPGAPIGGPNGGPGEPGGPGSGPIANRLNGDSLPPTPAPTQLSQPVPPPPERAKPGPQPGELDPLSLTTEMEPISEEVQKKRKVDATLVRFSAVHAEMAAEEQQRRSRRAKLMPWLKAENEVDKALNEIAASGPTPAGSPSTAQQPPVREDEGELSLDDAEEYDDEFANHEDKSAGTPARKSAGGPPRKKPPTKSGSRGSSRPQNGKSKPKRKVVLGAKIAALAGAVAILVLTFVGWRARAQVNDSIQQVAALDVNSPAIQDGAKQAGDENFLIIGTSTANDAATPQLSTVMVAHIPADRSRAVVVSFPTDLAVTRPTCKKWNNTNDSYGAAAQGGSAGVSLDSVYQFGGPLCVTDTVQALSGLRLNHFVGIDGAGFQDIVNSVNGVQVCTTGAISDSRLGSLVGQSGQTTLSGQQALNFVEAQNVSGDPAGQSGQITRQERFLAAALREAVNGSLLLSSDKLNTFLDVLTKSTFGDNLGVNDLYTLAQSLQGIDLGHVTFAALPTADGLNPAGLETPVTASASQLFTEIINNSPLADEVSPTGPSTTNNAPQTVAPDSFKIQVLNAGDGGLASSTAQKLTNQGFSVVQVGSDTAQTTTVIRYASSERAQALTLNSAVPDARLQIDPTLSGAVVLDLGPGFDGVVRAPDQTNTANTAANTQGSNGLLSTVNAADTSCIP